MRNVEQQRFNRKKRAAIKIQVIREGILVLEEEELILLFFPSCFLYLVFYDIIIFTGVSGICSISLAAFSVS